MTSSETYLPEELYSNGTLVPTCFDSLSGIDIRSDVKLDQTNHQKTKLATLQVTFLNINTQPIRFLDQCVYTWFLCNGTPQLSVKVTYIPDEQIFFHLSINPYSQLLHGFTHIIACGTQRDGSGPI